jgi:hypothetical protein
MWIYRSEETLARHLVFKREFNPRGDYEGLKHPLSVRHPGQSPAGAT